MPGALPRFVSSVVAVVAGMALLWPTVCRAEQIATPAQQSPTLLATDADVRREMESLRKLVIDHHTLITHRRLSPASGHKLASDVRRVGDTLAASRLARETPPLAALAAEVQASATLLDAAPASPEMLQGLMRLVAVLDRYPRSFAHPDWTPLQDKR